MPEIKLLSDSVINKIAAGEVVERPASVVKELVENSIDAGATSIKVEIEQGGRESIIITDNGKGIPKDELKLSICRHATSKIQSENDLFSIATMGFRGEALASISAVSKFTIKSRHESEAEGQMLEITSDAELDDPKVSPYYGQVGTTTIVESLFYNVPAREKFLKRAATEYGYILELIQALSLINPHIDFALIHNSKQVYRAYADETIEQDGDTYELTEEILRKRSAAIFKEDSDKLIYVSDTNEYGSVKALVSPPGLDKSSFKHIYAFVNGRWVIDKTVKAGILRGYHGHLLKGRYPAGIIVLQHDASLVDVNAHPAKTEVRFQYPGEVTALLALAIRCGIRQGGWASSPTAHELGGSGGGFAAQSKGINYAPSKTTQNMSAPGSFSSPSSHSLSSSSSSSTLGASGNSYGNSSSERSSSLHSSSASSSAPARERYFGSGAIDAPSSSSQSRGFYSKPQMKETVMSFDGGYGARHAEQKEPLFYSDPVASASTSQALSGSGNLDVVWSELNFIGTYAQCYLMFEGRSSELLVVDQHAFHERILFEKLLKNKSLLAQKQPLMIPELIAMAPSEVSQLNEAKDKLSEFGFDFNCLSDSEIEVTQVPSLLIGKDLNSLFGELAENKYLDQDVSANSEIFEHVLATIACHTAVRSGETLTGNELKQLMDQAQSVDFYHNCPHGRRVFKWFKKSDVGKWFDRL